MDYKAEGIAAIGQTPLPKVSDEAAALLVACQSALTNMALQGVKLPDALMRDLSAFTKEHIGYEVPWDGLVARLMAKPDDVAIEDFLEHLGKKLEEVAHGVNLAILNHNVGPDDPSKLAARLIPALGEIDAYSRRIAMVFGLSQMALRTLKRMELDAADRQLIQ